MARIRTVKPEFWTSEQIAECSPASRLLFIGMWNFCDDRGIHPESLKRLKMQIFPADEISISEIKKMIEELITNKLLTHYMVEDQGYWLVTGWKHQKIDKPNFRYPLPNDRLSVVESSSKSDRLPLDNSSPPEGSLMEGSGKESKGKKKEKKETKVSKKKNPEITLMEWESLNGELKPDQFIEWGLKNGYRNIPEMLSQFKEKVRAKGYTYIDFPSAFRSWDWKDYKSTPVTLFTRTPMPSPAGG